MKSIMALIHEKKTFELVQSQISKIQHLLDELIVQGEENKKSIISLEKVMPPDQTDVHNINRRIEILAQKIAQK